MESKVGFLGGMDRDSSLSKRDLNKYYDGMNIRVLTDNGLSTGSVINEKGNKLIFKLPPTLPATTEVSATSDFKIIGLGTMRDWIIIFSMDTNVLPFGTATVGNGQIWKCKYNKVTGSIEDILIGNELDPSVHLVYNNVLGFSPDYRIGEIISRYQDSTHGKIYFIDGLNTLKHINILDPNSLTLPLSSIDITPNIDFSQPKVTKILKGGSLMSGSIQYSYQLFNLGGAESAFAPASGIVHLTDKNEYASNTLNYKGAAPETNVGKSVVVSIDNIDTTFDYIRLISVYYTSQEGQPEISIIEEKIIPSSGSIEFTDDGNPIGVYSTTEYNSTGNRLFIPGTIATKNNYLVAANIKEEYFDVDELGYWDARAYRWNSLGQFKLDGVTLLTDPTLITETADCVLSRADSYTYMFNNDGVMGGEGINIKYQFVLTPIKIDSNSDDTKALTNIDAYSQAWNTRIDSTYIDNNSYTSYASPINREQLVGYTRDETYRFGIVFYDARGRQSFAKWIGDIKMPSMLEEEPTKVTYMVDATPKYDYNTIFTQIAVGPTVDADGVLTTNSINPGVYANILGVKFTVNNLPTGITSYRIVRVRREQQDKYILGQGLMGVTVIDTNPNTIKPVANVSDDSCTTYNTSYGTMVTFKSPEVLFTDTISPLQGDLIEIAAFGTVTSDSITGSGAANTKIFTNKIKSFTLPFSKTTAVVTDGIKASDKWGEDNNYKYVIDNAGARDHFLNHVLAFKGTVLALGLDNSLAVVNSDDVIILNYTKDPSLVQYGGNSYADRVNNTYIACGNLESSYVYGGDTYIGMFEYLNSMFDTGANGIGDVVDDKLTEVAFVPLESTVNVELTHGTSINKDNAIWNLCETVAMGNLIYPGSSAYDWGQYPAEYTDMYQYNTAYSAEPIGKTYSVKPQFFTNNQVNDYRVIVSEKHINNQLTDSWTKFLYNNMIEVNSEYGPITKIITFRNRLFFFQDNGFGLLGFEDRQLLNDNTGLPLVLGTGGILTSFQYISEKTGTKSKFGVIDTGSFLYFIDINNRKFMRFDGNSDECVSDKDNMSSFFRTYDYGDMMLSDRGINQGIHGVFDPINKRVLYTLLGTNHATFSFNEVLDNFESFYSFTPTLYENTDFGVISANPSALGECYLHTAGYRGVFYGVAYDSYVTHILAPHPDNKKVFNNLEFNSYVEVAGVDVPLATANTIQLWDSFQDTNVVTLTEPITIRRRFRTWRYQIPKVNSLRMMDYSLFTKLSFTNSISVDTYFRLDDITLHYLVPMI